MEFAGWWLVLLALLWIGYGVLHSLTASQWCKDAVARRWPRFVPAYRLAYNAVAVAALLPPLWMMARWPGEALWRWPGALGWLVDGVALAGVLGFVLAARGYHLSGFLGLRQWRTRAATVDEDAPFTLGPLHRHVRHPWYALALVVIWTREMDAALLVSALIWTAYLVLGSRLEERKLLARYGTAYERFRARVPGLVPVPWRRLGRAEAAELVALAGAPRIGPATAADSPPAART